MRKVPCVLQKEMIDCGPACLFAIFKYYDGKMSYSKFKRKIQMKKGGTDAYSLKQAGEELGFLVEGVKGEVEQIPSTEFPLIAHIQKENYYHFVVLMELDFKKKIVLLMDPAIGYHKVSLSIWKEVCTGNYLTFHVKRFLTKEKNISIWKLLFSSVTSKKSLYFALFGNAILAYISLLGLVEVKLFFSYLFYQKDFYNVFSYFLFFCCFHFLKEVGLFLFRWFFLKLQRKLYLENVKKWFQNLLYLPYYAYENQSAASFMSKTESFEQIYFFFFQALEMIATSFPLFIMALVLLGSIESCFVRVLFPCLLVVLVSSFFLFKKLEKKAKNYTLKKEKRDSFLLETIEKLDLLKGLHQESYFFKKWWKLEEKYQASKYRFSLFLFQKEAFQKGIEKGMQCIFFLLFLQASYHKNVSFSDFFLLQVLFELILENYKRGIELGFLYPQIKVEVEKLEPFYLIKKEQFPKKSLFPSFPFQLIEVKGFTYQVEGNKKKCNLFLKIKKNEKVILHGASGCGKSTFCKSLLKYYPIEKKELFLNGIDVAYIHLEDLRSRICYLSQEEGLFAGTLLENITLGVKIPKEKLEKVLELTHVTTFIKEKEVSLDFPISLLNVSLSGGERKKILLARALLLKRDIYLLDEVFESIPEEEAKELIKNVLTYLKNKIVLVISHRKNADSYFDQVCFFGGSL